MRQSAPACEIQCPKLYNDFCRFNRIIFVAGSVVGQLTLPVLAYHAKVGTQPVGMQMRVSLFRESTRSAGGARPVATATPNRWRHVPERLAQNSELTGNKRSCDPETCR